MPMFWQSQGRAHDAIPPKRTRQITGICFGGIFAENFRPGDCLKTHMPRIRGTTMDISFTFAAFCMPGIQPVTGHWPLVTYTVNFDAQNDTAVQNCEILP